MQLWRGVGSAACAWFQARPWQAARAACAGVHACGRGRRCGAGAALTHPVPQVGRMAGLTDLRLRLKRMSGADAHALAGLSALRSLDLEARTPAPRARASTAVYGVLNLYDRCLQPSAAPSVGRRRNSGPQWCCPHSAHMWPASHAVRACVVLRSAPALCSCPACTPLTGRREAQGWHTRPGAFACLCFTVESGATLDVLCIT